MRSVISPGAGGTKVTTTETLGAFISSDALTLSAASQALPIPPNGARRVFIQIQGGTVTDSTWVSVDGTPATTSDLVIRNAEDVVSSTGIVIAGT
ncbi:MAG: hypothetical protein WBM35_10685, partial [Candidatus Electrothrix sp.]